MVGPRPIDVAHIGLSKREYFAALAMAALIDARGPFTSVREDLPRAATLAAEAADALLEELAK